jgi:4-amino-4-deoxy-L-arabinose transferase-like glycosyltransferase
LVSLSWVTAFDLTPPDQRPYAGSTVRNSMLELALLHNGLNRFIPRAAGDDTAHDSEAPTADQASALAPPRAAPLWDQTPVGPLRLLTPHLAGQMAWWLPLVVVGVLLGGQPWRGRRWLSPAQAQVLLWAGWAATYAVVFSLAGGVFHTYYVAVLGPPLAALAGVGAVLLWRQWRDGARRWALPATLVVTAAWQAYIQQGAVGWHPEGWMGAMLLVVLVLLTLAAAATGLLPRRLAPGRLAAGLALSGLLGTLLLPGAWALSTVLARPNVAAPAADITRLTDPVAQAEVAEAPAPARSRSRRLLEFLRAHRQSERYLLAVPNAQQAAPFIVRTGEPIMAMGGYLGRDPILTPKRLERMVAEGELRYVILGGPSIVPPNSRHERVLAQWIRTHGRRVDLALWPEMPDANQIAATLARRPSGPVRLYDLRPDEPGGPSMEEEQ